VLLVLPVIFLFPLRLIQEPMEAGNIEEVKKILAGVWYPNLLYKPVRSTFYTIKGNIAMMDQDFDSAEKHLKKAMNWEVQCLKLKVPINYNWV
jgi:hypothetical protein